MNMSTKIILVDDNDAFRAALKNILEKRHNVSIVGEAASADDFYKIPNCNDIDIVLLDIMMPKIDGITLARQILWKNKDVKIIAITQFNDDIYLNTLLEAGFKGCIFKYKLFYDLESALNVVSKGNLFFPNNILINENLVKYN